MAEGGTGGIAGFIGNSVGEAAAFAAGLAIGPLLQPIVQELKNETWQQYPSVPLEAEAAAQAVAENALSMAQGTSEAKLTGIGATPFQTLVEVARRAPGVPEARELVWRANLSTDLLHHAYEKAAIEPQYWSALDQLLVTPLPPAVAALAAVRGLIPDEGTLPVSPPTETGVVPSYPVFPISGKAAAAAVGLSEDAYSVMVGINGRPMSLHEAASAYFRGIIKLPDFYRAVSEGDTRNEWRDAILEQARVILSPHDYAELHLRGWIDAPTMYAGTAMHGMSQADTDLLFENLGRPIPVHQVTTGLARGGTYNGPIDMIEEPYLRSMQEGNSRPEWYNFEYANRYTLPGYFVIKAILASGGLTVDEATTIFEQEGWPPDLAAKAAKALAPSSGQTGTKKLTATQIKAAWAAGQYQDEAQVLAALATLGYSTDDATKLFNTWTFTPPAPPPVG